MRLEVNGLEYSDFISASAEVRLDALSNSFSFTSVGTGATRPPFKVGDECRVIVGGAIILTGHIEVVSGDYDVGSHSFTYEGRDKTGDLVDSNISKLSDLGTSISLKSIIEKVINNLGLDIKVIDNVNPEKFNVAEDRIAPESGDNAFQFIEKYTRKRQVILTSNGDGDILILDTPGQNLIHTLQNLNDADNNNIISASFSYDETGRYNIYKMASGLNPLTFSAAVPAKDIVNQSSTVTDSGIRAGRQFVMVPESSYSNEQCVKRAQWEQRVRQARGQLYSAVVQGFNPPNSTDLWQINTVIGVLDDFAGINAEMLVNSVTYALDESSGSTTTLSLVEQNAYNLEITEPVAEKIGDGFAF